MCAGENPTFSNYRHFLSSNDTTVPHLIHSTTTQIPLLLVQYYNSNKATLEKQYQSTTTQISPLLVKYYSSNKATLE